MSAVEPHEYVRQAPLMSWQRLPAGWHTRFEERMWISLNCQGIGPGDANLAVHERGEERAGTGGDAEPRAIPEFLRDPRAAAAVVEWADRTALGRINQRCPAQDDELAQRAAWDEEFGRAAEECSARISAAQLMQVWSGCLAAAKALSPKNYWIGPISPWFRYNLFKHSIFPTCSRNELYRLGALAAPAFKAWRREDVTTDGVALRTCGDPEFMAWSDGRVLRPEMAA